MNCKCTASIPEIYRIQSDTHLFGKNQMLFCLGHGSVSRRNHKNGAIHLGGASYHVLRKKFSYLTVIFYDKRKKIPQKYKMGQLLIKQYTYMF